MNFYKYFFLFKTGIFNNDDIIGVVTVTDGRASINYSIPFTNITSYNITVTYEDNEDYAMKITTGNIIIHKTNT